MVINTLESSHFILKVSKKQNHVPPHPLYSPSQCCARGLLHRIHFLLFTRSLPFHASCPQSHNKASPALLVRLLQVVRVHLLSKAEMGARLLTCKLTTTRPSGSSYLSTRHNLGSAGKKSLNEGRQNHPVQVVPFWGLVPD